MPVYFAAAALAAFYLCMVPLKFALVLRMDPSTEPVPASAAPRPILLLGASAFEPRFAKRHARPLASHRQSKAALPSPLLLKAALKACIYLLRHLRLEQLRAHGSIATGDAAQTALLCGAAEAVQAACTPLNGLVVLRLYPDFSSSSSRLEATGMIGLRAGHIIFAALIFIRLYAAGTCSNVLKRLQKLMKTAHNQHQIFQKASKNARAKQAKI